MFTDWMVDDLRSFLGVIIALWYCEKEVRSVDWGPGAVTILERTSWKDRLVLNCWVR